MRRIISTSDWLHMISLSSDIGHQFATTSSHHPYTTVLEQAVQMSSNEPFRGVGSPRSKCAGCFDNGTLLRYREF